MERGRLNRILEGTIKEYISEVKPEIRDSMMSYLFEMNGSKYFYNLRVTRIDNFPIWICRGGDKIPKAGCLTIHDEEPIRCDYCENTNFGKIENPEEFDEWREIYE